eukprot:1161550-Pelagomonas_calceolata.AAC.2
MAPSAMRLQLRLPPYLCHVLGFGTHFPRCGRQQCFHGLACGGARCTFPNVGDNSAFMALRAVALNALSPMWAITVLSWPCVWWRSMQLYQCGRQQCFHGLACGGA